MFSANRSQPGSLAADANVTGGSLREPVVVERCPAVRDEFLELAVSRGATSAVQGEGELPGQLRNSLTVSVPEVGVAATSNPYVSPVMGGDPEVRLEYNRARGDFGKLNRRLNVWSDRQKLVLAAALGFGDLASSAFSGPLSGNLDGKLVFAAVVSVWAAALYKTSQKIKHLKGAQEMCEQG